MIKNLPLLFLLLILQNGLAQSLTGKVIDSKTKESIPYANLMWNGTESLVSNEDGIFTLSENKSSDSAVITVSYLGYVSRQMTVAELQKQNNTIALEQGIFALDDVNVSNVKPDANTIMAAVNKNLVQNYENKESTKDMLFVREVSGMVPKKLDFEITKSSGFSKESLKSANSQLNAFTSKALSNPSKSYVDMLCNFYQGRQSSGGDKTKKLEILKAVNLSDESRSPSLDVLQNSAFKIIFQHIDTTKYYRIKSGIIGSRDTISLRKDQKDENKKKKKTELVAAKSKMESFFKSTNFSEDSTLDFVTQTDLYEYTYEGAVYSGQNEFAYVITFKPKKRKANYEGKLYISESDFAVVKAEYKLAKGKTLSGINLKLLFGLKVSSNVSKGTLIYKQNQSGNGYYLQYVATETGGYMYVNRPIKLIEISEDEKDVVAFDLKMEGNNYTKIEMLNISRTEIPASTIANIVEKEFKYQRLKKYDASIWKEYSTIEPLSEMKQFKSEN